MGSFPVFFFEYFWSLCSRRASCKEKLARFQHFNLTVGLLTGISNPFTCNRFHIWPPSCHSRFTSISSMLCFSVRCSSGSRVSTSPSSAPSSAPRPRSSQGLSVAVMSHLNPGLLWTYFLLFFLGPFLSPDTNKRSQGVERLLVHTAQGSATGSLRPISCVKSRPYGANWRLIYLKTFLMVPFHLTDSWHGWKFASESAFPLTHAQASLAVASDVATETMPMGFLVSFT